MPDYYEAPPIPCAFIWRRAHSLTGIWLVLFLIEHLFTNSQAALYVGDDGIGFVRSVNWLKELPYLQAIEIFLLGVPLLIHGLWGVHYLFTSKFNSFRTDGTKPSLPQYPRNQAYTWQRITSWILLFGILAHVIQMRFIEYPNSAKLDGKQYYMLPIHLDSGLYPLSKRLDFELYDEAKIKGYIDQFGQKQELAHALVEQHLSKNQVLAVSPSFGTIELLMVRDTFKSPLMILLYTGLVLAACFHAFNGLWTSMISWGVALTAASQRLMRKMAVGLMVIVAFLGLAAIWGTYWINLY
jgi:succinate dehydrogenase / fumarate reductase, cytochrome b subunit